jgi:hypothetical protein
MSGPENCAVQGGCLFRWCGRPGPAHVRIRTLTEGWGPKSEGWLPTFAM